MQTNPEQWAVELALDVRNARKCPSLRVAAAHIRAAFAEQNARDGFERREVELMAELSGLDQMNIILVNLVKRAMRLIPEGKSLWWDEAKAALEFNEAPATIAALKDRTDG